MIYTPGPAHGVC